MKAVQAFSGKAVNFARTAFNNTRQAFRSAGSGGGSGNGSGDGASGDTMSKASRGMSAVGSIMEYAAARQQAAALDQSARDEDRARRTEYIQASESITAIDKAYNELVGAQMVAAAPMGIDAASGSVIAAREAAQDEADSERRRINNNADAAAAMRKVRSLALRNAAKNTRFGATIKLGTDLVGSFVGGR